MTEYKFDNESLCIVKYNYGTCYVRDFDRFDFSLPNVHITGTTDALNREGFNVFNYISNYQYRDIVMSAEIIVDEDKKVILCITNRGQAKVFLNNKIIVSNVSNYGVVRRIPVCLRKGKNSISIQQHQPNDTDILNITVLDEEKERMNFVTSLSSCNFDFVSSQLLLIEEDECCAEKNVFRFAFTQSMSNFDEDYKIEVYNWRYELIDSFYSKLEDINEINLLNYRFKNVDFQHLWFKCIFTYGEQEIVAGPVAFINNFSEANNIMNTKLYEIAQASCGLLKSTIMGKLVKQQLYKQMNLDNMIYWESYKNREFIERVKDNNEFEQSLLLPGVHELYIRSKLDNSYVRIGVSVPENYNSSATPAIFAIATSNDGGFCSSAESLGLNKDCLVFDISGRGYTGGSYIGEAAILEAIDWAKSFYAIDENRIYGLGYSNGGTAVLGIAQNHPDLFASIYPLAGISNSNQNNNLSNTSVYQIISDFDYVNENHDNLIANSIEYKLPNLLHIYLGLYLNNKQVIDMMLTKRKNDYPYNIHFVTYRNRHLKSYWIELLGIDNSNHRAECTVNSNADLINIKIENCSGIKITIPEFINRTKFKIIINNQMFDFCNYDRESVILHNDNYHWKVENQWINKPLYIGTGLLDVFYNKMQIVIPENSSKAIIDIANKLSKPYSNGLDPNIDVKYDIVTSINNESKNLIIINSHLGKQLYSESINKIMVNNKIICNWEGYQISNNEYQCDYVVMQIANDSNNNSILFIDTNNEKLLSTHLLLRKVIIPTYINGLHSYWNKNYVIYANKKYITSED